MPSARRVTEQHGRQASLPSGRVALPTISRARRWHDAVAELADLQAQYATWPDALPDDLRDSSTAEALQSICDFDLGELQAIEPPRGFGRD